MAKSKISWAHYSYNPWWACQRCGPECEHCYIYRNMRKQHLDAFAADGPYRTQTLNDPHDWQYELNVLNQHESAYNADGTPKPYGFCDRCGGMTTAHIHLIKCGPDPKPAQQYARVFICSHGDFFDRRVDQRGWREDVWKIIHDTPNLVYLILTKRPDRIADHLPADWPYRNVWLGTSTGCNATLARVDHLRKIPIHPEAVRFISAEPLLEDISENLNLDGIGWLVCGGESGDSPEYVWTPAMKWTPEGSRGRRTMDLSWAYRLMLAARRQGIPFMFKQITASRSGQGVDALGQIYHEYPNPPAGGAWRTEDNPLKVIQ